MYLLLKMNFKIMLQNSQKHTRKLVTNKETKGRETYEFIQEGADIFKPLDFSKRSTMCLSLSLWFMEAYFTNVIPGPSKSSGTQSFSL